MFRVFFFSHSLNFFFLSLSLSPYTQTINVCQSLVLSALTACLPENSLSLSRTYSILKFESKTERKKSLSFSLELRIEREKSGAAAECFPAEQIACHESRNTCETTQTKQQRQTNAKTAAEGPDGQTARGWGRERKEVQVSLSLSFSFLYQHKISSITLKTLGKYICYFQSNYLTKRY